MGTKVTGLTSECFDYFGWEDFSADAAGAGSTSRCPIRDCAQTLTTVRHGRGERPYCPDHGIRLHTNTFVYWNGPRYDDRARLRNFRFRDDLAESIALGAAAKAESHRLGYEMSEDALTWNVFVGLAEAGRLGRLLRFLTGRDVRGEPDLYLWGTRADVGGREPNGYGPLHTVRAALERDVRRYRTEPDVILVLGGRLVVCVEAKFGSGNPLAHDAAREPGSKPHDRDGLLDRYLLPASARTRDAIDAAVIGPRFHSQLFRNVVFASEMARLEGPDCEWHVVNLASRTQWERAEGRLHGAAHYDFGNPEPLVRAYLRTEHQGSFGFRTWEQLHAAVVGPDPALGDLDRYLRGKSAHFGRAFDLG
jgi:hypothetical protein